MKKLIFALADFFDAIVMKWGDSRILSCIAGAYYVYIGAV